MFKEGDKYIHFTKYGGVNIEEVKTYFETKVHTVKEDKALTYSRYSILTTKNFSLELDGTDGCIYKLDSFYESGSQDTTTTPAPLRNIK